MRSISSRPCGCAANSSRARFSGRKHAPTLRAHSSSSVSTLLDSARTSGTSLLAACYLYLIPLCSLVWKLLRRRRVTA